MRWEKHGFATRFGAGRRRFGESGNGSLNRDPCRQAVKDLSALIEVSRVFLPASKDRNILTHPKPASRPILKPGVILYHCISSN
jgi:hypothetical protein